MNKDRLNQVIDILSKYDNNDFVNYYELFDLDRNMNIDELNSEIRKKRLQVLFHPDQISFIPEEYHSKYLIIIDVIKDVIDTFSSVRKREIYDNLLINAIRKKQFRNRSSENNQYQEDKTEDLDEVNLASAVIANSKKYGFEMTMNALIHLVTNNETRGFTRDGGVRDIIKNIDRNKLINIINSSSIEDSSVTIEQIIMNYLTDLLYKVPEFKQQIGLIEQACAATYLKYDMNGYHNQTLNALNNYCDDGLVHGFTNVNNVRNYLDQNADKKNAEFYIKCALNNERKINLDYSYDSINFKGGNFRKMYVEMLQNKINYGQTSNQFGDGYNK